MNQEQCSNNLLLLLFPKQYKVSFKIIRFGANAKTDQNTMSAIFALLIESSNYIIKYYLWFILIDIICLTDE